MSRPHNQDPMLLVVAVFREFGRRLREAYGPILKQLAKQIVDIQIAAEFHATYERLAPEHGYGTREASAVPWAEVPIENRRLMIATVGDLIDRGVIKPGPALNIPVIKPVLPLHREGRS